MQQAKGNASKRPRRKTELTGEVIQEMIRKKAYQLHELRGGAHGRDIDDWLEAERIVKAEMKKRNKQEIS